jgi:hypothetical protein
MGGKNGSHGKNAWERAHDSFCLFAKRLGGAPAFHRHFDCEADMAVFHDETLDEARGNECLATGGVRNAGERIDHVFLTCRSH